MTEWRELRCPLCAGTFRCRSEAECEAHIASCGAFAAEYGEGTPRSGLVSGFHDAVSTAASSAPSPKPTASTVESACEGMASLLLPLVALVQHEGKPLDEAVELVAALAGALVQPSQLGATEDFGFDEMWEVTFGPYFGTAALRSQGMALRAAILPAVEAVQATGGAGAAARVAELIASSLLSLTAPSAQTFLAAGQRVVLAGLTTRPVLNGVHGTILHYEPSRGRYAVELDAVSDNQERLLLLRPASLQPLVSSSSGEAANEELVPIDTPQACIQPAADEGPVAASIASKLTAAFEPVAHLAVLNESSMHNVAKGSETHFKVIVISEVFAGMTLLERHRRVNEALAAELSSGVHALSIVAKTSEQWAKANGRVEDSPKCLGGSTR